MEVFYETKKQKIILFFVCVLAVFLITFHFTNTPKVWIDEGLFTEIARNIAMHGVWGIQIAPGNYAPMNFPQEAVSYPAILPVALSLKVFGTGIWQARLPMILYMFALLVAAYLFVKKRYGFYPAILSVLMLLSFSPFYGDGRSVLGEVPGLVFLVLGAWLFLLLEESNFTNRKFALLFGLAFGLAAATKGLYLLGVSGALFITAIFWFRQIKDKKIFLTFSLGFIPPVLIWAYIHLIASNSLLNLIPTYMHLASNHSSSLPLSQTILINVTRFFTESTPILFLFLVVGITTSFLFRFFKTKSESSNSTFSIAECVLVSFILLNWVGYLAGTGWYRYFFPAHALLYVLFPGAVYMLSRSVNNVWIKRGLCVIPIALIMFQFVDLVFVSDNSLVHNRTRNDTLALALSNIDPSKKVLFYNDIEAIIFLKGNNYSQYFYCDGCNLAGGDKDSLYDRSYDYILTNDNVGYSSLPGYDKQTVDKYYLFKKI